MEGRRAASPAMREWIERALKPRNGPLDVLTIGCPANVSSAILAGPKIKDKIVVVWLGGATHEWPSAREFTLMRDLHASRVLFDSSVPLVRIRTKNVSEHLRTTLPEAEYWLDRRLDHQSGVDSLRIRAEPDALRDPLFYGLFRKLATA